MNYNFVSCFLHCILKYRFWLSKTNYELSVLMNYKHRINAKIVNV